MAEGFTDMTQRWRDGDDSYRPAGEPIRTSLYDVAPILTDTPAKDFILKHHYSGSYPAARFRFGLYTKGNLAGVAVFSVPCNAKVLSIFPGDWRRSVELGRFVLLDFVPANGETWFLARCMELLKQKDIIGIVSFSDPMPRPRVDGRIIFPGHVGTIYQAANARYLGRSTPRTLRILPDATVFSDRAIQKVRTKEQGWVYSARILMDFGADEPWEDSTAWVNHWLKKLTRPLKHKGNHRYAWVLPKRERRLFMAGGTYPKSPDA